jgi:hypothetical protein
VNLHLNHKCSESLLVSVYEIILAATEAIAITSMIHDSRMIEAFKIV